MRETVIYSDDSIAKRIINNNKEVTTTHSLT